MKETIIISAVILMHFMNSNISFAQTSNSTTPHLESIHSLGHETPKGIGMKKEILENRVRSKVLLNIDKKSAELINDGVEAVDLTRLAIKSIEDNNIQAAIDYIGVALGKLETISIRSPQLSNIPISRRIRTDDLSTNLKDIKIVKENISKALEEDKFHLARMELESLLSEVRIETTHIPISTFPVVLRNALISIDNNDIQTAQSNLHTLLHTLTVSKDAISLPCMRAEVLLEESISSLIGSEHQITHQKLLLISAKEQIDIAHELGQLDKEDRKNIVNEISNSIHQLGTTKFAGSIRENIALITKAKNKYGNYQK